MVARPRDTMGMELPTLRDDDLVLRPKRPQDAAAITAACQDPEIPRWTLVPSPYTRAHADEFILTSEAEAAAGTSVSLLAVDAAADRLLGSFSLMELDRAPRYGEIGYWVAATERGRGVAPRAVRLLTGWAQRELGLERIEILAHRDNAPSRRVAEKAGYRDSGELRACPRGDPGEQVYAVYVADA
jgi:RimJ/RimL family protein N-acetyltransferase